MGRIMNKINKDFIVKKDQIPSVETLKGIFRKTLVYNNNIMLCHFYLKKGSEVPIHSHEQDQVGYVIRGKLQFFTPNHEFIASKGDSYLFNSNEKHGAKVLSDSEVIDIFSPFREDYI